ncbi:sulfotransferase family protein [Agrilutibacter solisilvae]|uniref:Sulfotransferase n=1 Tax=Agrilutibacter solisilvae TaxID=2763317 RepID=A0A974Y1I3_9GAMM|nr:sulfotransferase [Lysobacter solisilvae]QSX79697.1 sulfotransferase [Lysobacter solisilvae]
MSSGPRYVLVLGCQRSGTTLMGQMLGAHPDALLIDEDEGAYKLVNALVQGDPVEPVFDEFAPRALRKYADARQREGRAPTHVVLKAPNATFHPQALARSAQPLACVFALRDVREVAHSMASLQAVPFLENQRRKLEQAPEMADRFASQIRRLADPTLPASLGHAIIWTLKSGLYRDFCTPPLDALPVRYDRLVEDPAGWLARMQAHVGLPQAPHAHHEVMQGLAVGDTQRGRAVDGDSRGKWKDAFTAQELDAIQAEAGPLMAELGLPW